MELLISSIYLNIEISLGIAVPSEPPSGIKVQHKISLDTITITWNALREDVTNGRFQGYKVKYTKRKVAGVDVMTSESNTKEIIVDKYTLKLKINGLLSYSSYDISVCGFTEAGNGPFSKPVLAGNIKLSYCKFTLIVHDLIHISI